MSAEVLREAAALMRTEQEREESLGHIDGREYATWLAVADWLDWTAENGMERNRMAAQPVARAYLGDRS